MNNPLKTYRQLFKSFPVSIVIAVSATTSAALGQALLMGDQVKQSVSKVNSELRWGNNLEQCKWQARKEGKLVFWLHMLGSLNGYT